MQTVRSSNAGATLGNPVKRGNECECASAIKVISSSLALEVWARRRYMPELNSSRTYPYPVVYCRGEVRRLHGKGPTGLRSTFAQAFVPVLQCKRNGFELVKQCDGIASTGIWSGQRLRLLICFHSRLCGIDCVLAIQSNINTEKCNSIFGKNTQNKTPKQTRI